LRLAHLLQRFVLLHVLNELASDSNGGQ
jgi:hypothetical protein